MLLEQHATSSALGKARRYLSAPDGENKYRKLKLNIRILTREIIHYHLGLKYFSKYSTLSGDRGYSPAFPTPLVTFSFIELLL